jgi:hypothetical protein
MITCTNCRRLYDARSEDQAGELVRFCPTCRPIASVLTEIAEARRHVLVATTRLQAISSPRASFAIRLARRLFNLLGGLYVYAMRVHRGQATLASEASGGEPTGPNLATLAIDTAIDDPPLVLMGPGGDFTVPHRVCDCGSITVGRRPCIDCRQQSKEA